MSSNDKRMVDREALSSVIQQWNANRLDLFELSEPNEVSPIKIPIITESKQEKNTKTCYIENI